MVSCNPLHQDVPCANHTKQHPTHLLIKLQFAFTPFFKGSWFIHSVQTHLSPGESVTWGRDSMTGIGGLGGAETLCSSVLFNFLCSSSLSLAEVPGLQLSKVLSDASCSLKLPVGSTEAGVGTGDRGAELFCLSEAKRTSS